MIVHYPGVAPCPQYAFYGSVVQQVETEDFNVFSTIVDYDFRRECLRGNS